VWLDCLNQRERGGNQQAARQRAGERGPAPEVRKIAAGGGNISGRAGSSFSAMSKPPRS
jgi:hypothetical protein